MPAPTKPPCWPDDPDYLDGYTKIDFPSERFLRVYFDADILDPEEEPSHKIIEADDPFTVRFRLALTGDLWTCVCGDWWFDLGFNAIGKGPAFDLSDLVGKERFYVKDWKGCDTRCIELPVTVPGGTIKTELCGIVYEVAAKFQLLCCGRPAPVVGFEALEERQFFTTTLEDEPS
jgi:hypothetical protein